MAEISHPTQLFVDVVIVHSPSLASPLTSLPCRVRRGRGVGASLYRCCLSSCNSDSVEVRFGSDAATSRLLSASIGHPTAIDFAFTGAGGAVNEQGLAIGIEDRPAPPVFISYATADRAEALKVCKAIERRGIQCWISMRDVPPGANYQEAIVQSLRTARALVLVFSDAANTSDEIKKELSLASRYHVPVIALRSRTSSRAMRSPTNYPHVSGSTRLKAGTGRSAHWLTGSGRCQARGH